MRRFIIGAMTLSVLLVLGLSLSFLTERLYAPIAELLEDAAKSTILGDIEDGLPKAMEAMEKWKRYKKATATVADHTPMEDIDHLFREMEIYAATDEAPHFAACCAQLAAMIRDMGDAHRLSAWNLL